MRSDTKAVDMTQGSPTKLLIVFALPMLVGAVFQLCYNMVDTIILGKFVSPEALAAVGSASAVNMMYMMASNAATNAMSILTSQAWGAKDEVRVRRTVAQSVALTVSWGVLLGLIAFFTARPLLKLLGAPENIIDGSVTYVKIVCGLLIGSLIYNSTAQILRAIGDSRTPLYFLILSCILNVVLDLAFVLWLDAAVAGVAWATVISQSISAVLCLVYMWRKYPQLRFSVKDMVPERELLRSFLRIAGPMFLQNMILSVGDMVISSVINSFGSDIVAAYTIGGKVQQMVILTFSQTAFAFSIFAGQNYGAKQYDRISEGMRSAVRLILCGLVISMTVMWVFASQLVAIFVTTESQTILTSAVQMVRVSACFLPGLGFIWLVNSCLRGIGAIQPTVISSMVELVAKIGLSIALSTLFGTIGIWFAAPIGWVLGLIPGCAYYFFSGWKKKALAADQKEA